MLREFAAILFQKRKAGVDLPTGALQLFGRDQRVAAVVTLSRKNDAAAGLGKELADRAGDADPGLVHQGLDGDLAGEGCLFSSLHLR